MIVNKAQLADLLGYSEQTLTDWQAEGLPILAARTRGHENDYDSAAVIAWLLARAERKARAGAESARDEYYRSQKRKVDLEILEKERALVAVDEVERLYTAMVLAFRRRILEIPGRLAHELGAAQSIEARHAMLEGAVHEALLELSRYGEEAGS